MFKHGRGNVLRIFTIITDVLYKNMFHHFRVTKAENDIPRFNTRRSLRQGPNNRWKMDSSNMPPVTVEGFLERKQQSNSGGKRSTIRSWKNYYTVIFGQSLWFFKDQRDFKDWKAATASISLYNATCKCDNYVPQ